jgi:uncharacterized protein YciI
MSESVDILIKAEDLATPVIKQSAKAVDGLDAGLKRIKESGGQAKKSADFARIIASSLGGSEIGSYIAQMGEAAEKTAQFAEVQKLGGAGALAFKAGLVGLVGTLAFQVGKGISNVIYQTEKYNKELDAATKKSKEFTDEIIRLSNIRLGETREDIELIRDPDAKKARYAELLETTKQSINDVTETLQENRKAVKEWNDGWYNGTAGQKVAEALVADGELMLKNLVKQQEELVKLNSERVKDNELLKKQNELQDKSEAYVDTLRQQLAVLKATNDEKAAVVAGQNTVGDDTGEATRILKEIDAINAKAEAEKIAADELKKIESEKENNAKRLVALKENELTKLAEEKILLEQGREAANRFALEKQGLAKADAAAIAREREQIEQQKDAIKEAEKPKKEQGATINTAFESRLLTRGPADDAAKFTAQNTANALAELKAMNARQERMEAESRRQKGRITTLTVVK